MIISTKKYNKLLKEIEDHKLTEIHLSCVINRKNGEIEGLKRYIRVNIKDADERAKFIDFPNSKKSYEDKLF